MTFTVGFDLDMTLIDPRPGMADLFHVLAAETGIPLDGAAFVSRLGPPLASEFARYGLTADQIDQLVSRYRELYPDIVIPNTTALPGAADAIEAVERMGGRAIVVTAKQARLAEQHLQDLAIEVDVVVGELWASGKAAALQAYGAEIYVGDHLGDITGARTADALSVAVATGPISAADLEAAGADAVMDDLTEFPDWLGAYLNATVH